MAMDTLLSQIEPKGVNEVLKDIKQIMRVYFTLLRDYEKGQSDVTDLMKKFENAIKYANKKYRGIFFKLLRKSDDLKLGIFIKNERSIKDAFMNAASKILGLKAIGTQNLGEVEVSQSERFNDKLESAKDNIYITYDNPDFGTQTLVLEFSKKQKMIELIYEMENIQKEEEPDFKIFTYYALIEGYDRKIDLYSMLAQIGLTDLLYYKDRKEYLEKFDPRFLE